MTFTPETQEGLNYDRYHHPMPPLQRRMEVLWLKSLGLADGLIANLGVCPKTDALLFSFVCCGLDQLKRGDLCRPTSDLDAYINSLDAQCQNYLTATIKDSTA